MKLKNKDEVFTEDEIEEMARFVKTFAYLDFIILQKQYFLFNGLNNFVIFC